MNSENRDLKNYSFRQIKVVKLDLSMLKTLKGLNNRGNLKPAIIERDGDGVSVLKLFQ